MRLRILNDPASPVQQIESLCKQRTEIAACFSTRWPEQQ
jgi:hypothetical protein